jgi:hypothetical protein
MRKISNRFLVAFVAVAIAVVGISTGVYAATRGASKGGVAAGTARPNASISITNCKVPKADFITNDTTGLSTTSTTYVAVPGMTKTINIAGNVPSCVLVDASAFAFAPGGALEFVSVTLDGNQGNPIETQFAGDTKGVYAEEHASLFGFAGVSPGSHTVALVFKSFDGKQVFLHRPAMEIDHK